MIDDTINEIIPIGWRLFSVDASTGTFNIMLERDAEGKRRWHLLTDEEKDEVELYNNGVDRTFDAALREAAQKCVLANLKWLL